MSTRSGLVALPIVFALFAAACDQEVATPGASMEDSAPVVTVNGVVLDEAELQRTYDNLPDQMRQMPIGFLRDQLVEQMVDRQLIVSRAIEEGYRERESVKERVAAYEGDVMMESWVFDEIERRLTDERVRADYDQMVAEFASQPERKARHILLETEDEAKAVIAELNEGADFAELAKERSTGPSGESGGDLGYFTKDRMVDRFAEAAFSQPVGSYSEAPVETEFGWHVILVEEERMSAPPSFEEAASQLRRASFPQIFDEIRSDLRAAASIQYHESELDAPADNMAPPPGEDEYTAPEIPEGDDGSGSEGDQDHGSTAPAP